MPRSRATSSPASPDKRLPVNPRRHKVPIEQRKRVATACNSCNVKRVKCSGERPCRQCKNTSRECIYPVTVDKVTIAKSELDALHAKCAALERCLQEAVPDSARRQQLLALGSKSIAPRRGSDGLHSPAASPVSDGVEEESAVAEDGRLLQDTDGTARYLGETSGATFLDNLKQFMSTIFPLAYNGSAPSDPAIHIGNIFLSSVGRYQTSDSQPLLVPIVDPLWLPTSTEMSVKLSDLRYFIQEGGAISGGIYFWGDLTSLPHDEKGPAASTAADLVAHRPLAFYHAAFAYSTLFGLTTTNSKQDGQLGETYFARAKMLLGNPLEVATYSTADVAALALMGMYMVEMNRRDAAYMYITTAMHIYIMHGVHRGWSVDEMGKRVFWTVYILDRWMSCLMGRPPTIQDEVIRLDLPREVPGLPTCVGICANIELSRIAGHVVRDTYRSAPGTWNDASSTGLSHVDKVLRMLWNWQRDLAPALQLSQDTLSRDRPLCTLHMNHNQLLILAIRPMFLVAVKKAVADRFFTTHSWHSQERDQQQTEPSRPAWARIESHPQVGLFRDCSDAARRNLRLGRWLAKISPASKLLLPDMHCIFNAAILLLLHQIVFVDLRTDDVSDISFALEAFAREADVGDAYAGDCLRVMQDLAGLVRRLRSLMFDGVPHVPSPHFAPAILSSSAPSPLPSAGLGLPISMIPLPSPGLEGHGGADYMTSSPGHQQQQQQQHHSLHHHHQQPHHLSVPVTTMAGTQAPLALSYDGVNTGLGMLPLGVGSGEALYAELMTWLDNDEMSLNGMYAGQMI
ncbi:hypothetical protein MGG_04213 [Pyricularia oryzae 70-15]|uniref:Zn(2)-C6 fungal-type domain-containing protein n=1 Tax=Pyricularia oryzae (strain 70-15 / ATCC MYA-4617 / FGSC 8958) TaxID=242507 RepID=G4NF45_PYRO7|nr:uncharacterized protein MGG_04213 [Pyricularia oryzae 70-15]EHA47236.1 hypothetical protein MGG_04213 [Pyricularia oryzae 70-15]KAI7929241.1 hypothetical protein M9X92_001435 [Pyricularia oryzae]KAI7930077.1 hypothetical protein M0657_001882 [Pyricularia oryzae]